MGNVTETKTLPLSRSEKAQQQKQKQQQQQEQQQKQEIVINTQNTTTMDKRRPKETGDKENVKKKDKIEMIIQVPSSIESDGPVDSNFPSSSSLGEFDFEFPTTNPIVMWLTQFETFRDNSVGGDNLYSGGSSFNYAYNGMCGQLWTDRIHRDLLEMYMDYFFNESNAKEEEEDERDKEENDQRKHRTSSIKRQESNSEQYVRILITNLYWFIISHKSMAKN